MATIDEYYLTDLVFENDFQIDPDGDLACISGLKNLKQALFHRFITTPGTLVHRPDFGVGVKDYQNAPMTLENQRSLALRTKEQFEQDFRVDSVEGFSFTVDPLDPYKLTVFVRIKPSGFQEVTMEFVPFGDV